MSTCQPFSIMRLTHEAIRSGLNQLEQLNRDLTIKNFQALKQTFEELKRVIDLHATQEDNVFYPPLEEKHPDLTKDFSAEHDEEYYAFIKLTEQMEAIEEGATDFSQLQSSVTDWVKQHRAHLVHEEEILMKLLPKTFTYVESVAIVRSILEYDLKEYEEFQLAWVFERLKAPQKEMYLGMLKGCSPKGKFPDFVDRIRHLVDVKEIQLHNS